MKMRKCSQNLPRMNVPQRPSPKRSLTFPIAGNPGIRDRIVGIYRPFAGERNNAVAANALKPVINEIIGGKRGQEVKLAAIEAAVKLRLTNAGESLHELLAAGKAPAKLRLEALKGLEALKDSRLNVAAKIAQSSNDDLLRKEGNRLMNELYPEEAVTQIRATLKNGSLVEKQGAYDLARTLASKDAETVLADLIEDLNPESSRQNWNWNWPKLSRNVLRPR